MFEQIEFVIDQPSVKLANAVGVSEEVRARVGEVITGAVGHVMRDLDFFHLIAIDGVGAEVARDR